MEADIGTILTAVFSFVTVLMAVIPTLMIKSRKSKLQRYIFETEAEVINMTRERFATGQVHRYNDSYLWVPTFRYYAGGQEIIHHSHVGTSEKIYEIGNRVPIKVDPYDPNKFVLLHSKPHKLAVGILYAISAFFLLITVIASITIR